METLLLHLDEQLTNDNPGRIRGNYSIDDLAFWIQFYSLLFDKVYFPVNFLTDSKLAMEVLISMGINNPDSAIRSSHGPLKILWDTSRFPYNSFYELVEANILDDNDVTMRNVQVSRRMAELCDYYLQSHIVRTRMTIHLNPQESVFQLRNHVFNQSNNVALPAHTVNRLNECLDRIVERANALNSGGLFGFGRNFYYSIFGYGNTDSHQRLFVQFEDIVSAYWDLRGLFLTGVDYVSHRIKTKFASEYLDKPISMMLPDEYSKVIIPRNKYRSLNMIASKIGQSTHSTAPEPPYILDRQAIIGMKAHQVVDLHGSNEYQAYQACQADMDRNMHRKGISDIVHAYMNLNQRFSEYMDLIGNTFRPVVDNNIVTVFVPKTNDLLAAVVTDHRTFSKPASSRIIELRTSRSSDIILEDLERSTDVQYDTREISDDILLYMS